MRLRRLSLRSRLTAGALAGAAIALTVLIAAFNLVLDARLRTDADNVLRERAVTVLRGLGTVDGRLSVTEAPDQGAVDAQTWIFVAGRMAERPAGVDSRNQSSNRIEHRAFQVLRIGRLQVREHTLSGGAQLAGKAGWRSRQFFPRGRFFEKPSP